MSFLTRTDTLDINIGPMVIPTKITRYKFVDLDLESPNSPSIEIVAFSMDDYILRVVLTDYNYYLLDTLLGYVGHKILNIDYSILSDQTIKSLVRLYPSTHLADGKLQVVL